MRPSFGWCALSLAVACRPPPVAPAKAEPTACRYDVTVLSEAPLTLDVEARCRGNIAGFSRGEERVASYIRARDGKPLARGKSFPIAAAPGGTLRYQVDLEGAARESDRFDVAERIGRSLIAPASSFLLVPEPVDVGIPITVNVHAPNGDFTSALERGSDGSYHLQAHEIGVATYCVFGDFRTETLVVGSSTLEVATLDGELAASPALRRQWIETDARGVADFYGVFPAAHALITLIPLSGHAAVDFGKLLPASGPGVALVVGSRAQQAALYDDWILVHELFHIGFPSFNDEGKWLDEGSATYFEPIIRARLGQLSEREVWRQFITQMPQGFDAMTRTGLERTSFRGIYWGGALACLMVDVAARRASGNRRGLEDAFRAVLAAGGNATQVWSLERVVGAIDRALGGPFLSDLVKAHAQTGSPFDADALFHELGVRIEGDAVTLDDAAPLAALRHSIVRGAH